MATPFDHLLDLYKHFHRHPELGGQEHQTANIVRDELSAAGYVVTDKVGGTGVVALLTRGDGPTVMLRADMDALPVTEATGLPYASETDGVMHACGHDMHVTCLLGAAAALAADETWQGTLMLVFQPAEEIGVGAQGMIDDGLFERFGTPDVILGQHVAPLPVGVLGIHSGPAFAGDDKVRITLHGRGGHGSRPESTIDPVLMAAHTTVKLQSIVSRETAAGDAVVVTVGAMRAGTAANVIPDTAELLVSARTFTDESRTRVLNSIERIAAAEAASTAADAPEIEVYETYPPLVNDANACATVHDAFRTAMSELVIVDPGAVTGSEDLGRFATASGAPLAYWVLGGADPALFDGARTTAEIARKVAALPSNHSSRYAPVPEPTLRIGIRALQTAALAWLATPR
ncbi:amidohydrolase [Streptomyces sp. UH6]|uniref:amidohydrolase n=1 Tax=Streptomyces sp. UH6 TaxID=2748379 RepID=UPI0015D48FCD|nr:amidohydrolase [Streptomyces sp. UH6]NYV72912.1 amidohydrolase [Streptomyces sp. UH6]